MAQKRRRQQAEDNILSMIEMRAPARPTVKPLQGMTPSQVRLIRCLGTQRIVFAVGSAGTGKSYVCAAVAADALREGEVERIVVTRPMVSAEDDVGALPGTLEEKIAPYLAPVRNILDERLGRSHVDNLIRMGRITAVPVAFLRGHSFADTFVLADEAQNLSARQFKLLLTRIGRGSRLAITGDSKQVDIRDSGLEDAIRRISHIPAVSVVEFDRSDVVRDDIVAEILQAYDE